MSSRPLAMRHVGAPSVRFLIQALIWTGALFGLIRLPWVSAHIVTMLVTFQTTLVEWYGVNAASGLAVTADCSGADVAAICLGVTLSYPLPWRRRLAGAAIGVAMVFVVNIVRLASLFAVAESPARLNLLHLYVWPALLSFVVLGYVFLWFRWNSRRGTCANRAWVRFFRIALPTFVAYAAAAPWVFGSRGIARACTWTAMLGATVLGVLGAHAQAAGSVLTTARGGFIVTPECLYSAAIPVFIAAVLAMPMPSRRRWIWLAAAPAIFFTLGVARLLSLALPALIVQEPIVLVHEFYQIVVGAMLIVLAAHQGRRGAPARDVAVHAAVSLAVAIGAAILLGAPWRMAVEFVSRTSTPIDQQGALRLLPAYQLSVVTALWIALTGVRRWSTLATSLAVLAATQIVLLVAFGAYERWTGGHVHALVVRAFAVVIPALLGLRWIVRPSLAGFLTRPDQYSAGIEYVIDAHGCDPARLRSLDHVRGLVEDALRSLRLREVTPPLWQPRPRNDGWLGMTLLSESHLSIHTYASNGVAVINLYCCRANADWPWESRVAAALGATRVTVRVVPRGRPI